MFKYQWDSEPLWSDRETDKPTPCWGAPPTETGIQSIKMKGKASRSTLEFWKKRHSIFNYCQFFFFFAATMKRKRVLKSRRKCDVLQLWVSGKPGKQLWNEADGLFIHSGSSQFQKNNIWHFGISARGCKHSVKRANHTIGEIFCSRSHVNIIQGFYLTWAMPPTNLVFTTTLSSSVLSNAAFWAAFTRLSEARFTALPAAFQTDHLEVNT